MSAEDHLNEILDAARRTGTAHHDLEHVLNRLTNDLRNSVAAEFAMIGEAKGNVMQLGRLSGQRHGGLDGQVVRRGQGLGGRVLASGRIGAVENYLASVMITHEFDSYVIGEGLQSFLALPVIVDGDVAAVAYVAERRETTFGDRGIDRIVEAVRQAKTQIVDDRPQHRGDDREVICCDEDREADRGEDRLGRRPACRRRRVSHRSPEEESRRSPRTR